MKEFKDLRLFRLKAELNKQVIRVVKVKYFQVSNQATIDKVQEFKEEKDCILQLKLPINKDKASKVEVILILSKVLNNLALQAINHPSIVLQSKVINSQVPPRLLEN